MTSRRQHPSSDDLSSVRGTFGDEADARLSASDYGAQLGNGRPAMQDGIRSPADPDQPDKADAVEAARGFPLEEIEFVWDDEIWSSPRPRARESLPTLPDADPLRYDLSHDESDITRDSMPTLPDTDPLRHDSEAPPSIDTQEQPFSLRKLAR